MEGADRLDERQHLEAIGAAEIIVSETNADEVMVAGPEGTRLVEGEAARREVEPPQPRDLLIERLCGQQTARTQTLAKFGGDVVEEVAHDGVELRTCPGHVANTQVDG